MSNILIIKHGSLGDIVQISGILRDIKETFTNKKIFILTTLPYAELLSNCPYIDEVIVDKRLPRWNIYYLIKLRKILKKYNFLKVFDLQNSSRTKFYKKYLFNISDWSSSDTVLKKKKNSNKDSVLERFKIQLNDANVKTNYTLNPDFSWAKINIDNIVNKYFNNKFILIFPFCSPKLSHKKWPYFNELIKLIKLKHPNLEIATAPDESELSEAKKFEARVITNGEKTLNIMELAGLIEKASYIIANDTGPAHIAAHLKKEGTVLFGHHTTAKKVSIETDNFKSISVKNLNLLTAESVYSRILGKLNLIY